MKKNFIFRILVSFFILLSLGITQKAFADNTGDLQLNPSIITDSGANSGGSDDFPIKSELFLPDISAYAKDQENTQKEIPQKVGGINFGKMSRSESGLSYSRANLFQNYKPTVLIAATNQSKTLSKMNIWIVVIIFIGIIFMILAFVLGRKNAKRSRRKRYEKSH